MRAIEPIDIMRYYVTYFDIEKNILDAIHSDDYLEKEKQYYVYVNNHMKIGRNFKPKSASMVLLTVENMLFNEGNLGVIELSNRYVRNEIVSSIRIKKVEVAASKLLWLYDKQTIIMDNNNKQLLKANDYNDYLNKWINLFDSKEKEIIEVTERNFKNINQVVNEKWFRMRVFDQYLLSIYDEQK